MFINMFSEKGLLWQNYHTGKSVRNYSLKDVQLSKYASFYEKCIGL